MKTPSPAEQIKEGIAVITGAGSGLGRALSCALVAEGVNVVGFGRRIEALAETKYEAEQSGKASFTPMQVDVSEASEVRRAYNEIGEINGRPTILINNAGVYPHRDSLSEYPEDFMQTMAINLGGVVNCTATALQYMKESGIGRIINVGSFADIAPLPASAAYSVSKGAGQIYVRALVADIGDRLPNIVISTWMPGALATDMGIPEGLKPEVAAAWGAKLALWHDPSLNGSVFEMNQEVPPTRGLKSKVKDMLLLRRGPKPRMIPS